MFVSVSVLSFVALFLLRHDLQASVSLLYLLEKLAHTCSMELDILKRLMSSSFSVEGRRSERLVADLRSHCGRVAAMVTTFVTNVRDRA